ncbi:MAG: hypothetical protein ABEJ68_06595 [Halobacteriaceae archaeon]
MFERRQILGALGTAGATLLAGCGSSGNGGGGQDYATPGESRELSGIRFTVTSVTETTTVDAVAPDVNDTATTYRTTRLTAGEDSIGDQRRFLVVDLTAENTGDSAQELPAPAPTPPAAAGRISITGAARGVNPRSVTGQLLRDSTPVESFGARVADLNWSLPPGESVSGWLLFRVSDDFNRTTNTLTVEIDATTARWQLKT